MTDVSERPSAWVVTSTVEELHVPFPVRTREPRSMALLSPRAAASVRHTGVVAVTAILVVTFGFFISIVPAVIRGWNICLLLRRQDCVRMGWGQWRRIPGRRRRTSGRRFIRWVETRVGIHCWYQETRSRYSRKPVIDLEPRARAKNLYFFSISERDWISDDSLASYYYFVELPLKQDGESESSKAERIEAQQTWPTSRQVPVQEKWFSIRLIEEDPTN